MHTHHATQAPDRGSAARDLPPGAIRVVASSAARLGLLSCDGRIATLSRRLSCDLGFDRPEDLRGLQVSSLWHHADRPAVTVAFDCARQGRTAKANVSLSYVSGQEASVDVTFTPGQAQGSVLMTLDWAATDNTPATA